MHPDDEALLLTIVGKTVKNTETGVKGFDEWVLINFTDGTAIQFVGGDGIGIEEVKADA